MPSFFATVSSEWTKLWSVRSTWWCLVGATALMAIYAVPLGFDAAEPNPELSHADQLLHVEDVATAGLLFTQFALIALALLTVTSEYASGSMRTTLQCEPRRGQVLAAKLVVVEVVALASGALLAFLGAGLGYLTAGDYGVFDVSAVAEVAGRVSVYLGVVVALAVGLAVGLRSTAGALVVAFLALFLLPMVLIMSGMDLMTDVSFYLPGTAGTEYLGIGIATLFGLSDELPYGRNGGLGLLATWAAVTLLAGFVVFRRRDA
ncbi:ABC-2 type transport system permease protein [Nocardioides albertanoniae]|uniref:ABC-2 type transport system permease protein n=1 Tax=Nocardioides albertanoniae TaxID=1175486 RepID=A0A543A3V3_9ACTN|nr:ABC transporter permease subunit [Nocardioides albertanoniae]TQL67275.1 ABC-2 type transport system permease protein [Nocardioides albertanoniae]